MTSQPVPQPILPGDASDIDRIVPNAPITPGEEKVPAGPPFQQFMQGKAATPEAVSGKSPMVSPFELAGQGKPIATSTPTLDTLTNQVNMAQSTLGDLNTHIQTPGLKLKPSEKYLLKNKLGDANTRLRVANAKMGAEAPEEVEDKQFSGPFAKFIKLISGGQGLMESAQKKLADLKEKGGQLAPADFLTIQFTMNQAQNQLEYSSVLLSNAVSAIKSLMQTQL